MLRKLKRMLQILVGVVLAVQLVGCFFGDRDRWRHDDHQDRHNGDHGPDIDVRVH